MLEYVAIDSQSAEGADRTPSTPGQRAMSGRLRRELEELGLQDVFMDEHAYVYGRMPASPGCDSQPHIGLIAHVDTSPDFPGGDIRPRVIDDYDGEDVALGDSGRVLEVSRFPKLPELRGQTLIVTDGRTLLGADDKAGAAEIMTACERLISGGAPHCALSVCFTPDEEIGHGAALLSLERLGADFAYTVDGDDPEEINYETFNAASAVFDIRGVNVHPGSAKGLMVNASLLAMEISALLPAQEIPAATDGYQGFFHLTDMSGTVESARLKYIIRDHDAGVLERRCALLRSICDELNLRCGAGTVTLTITPQYRNMAQVLSGRMEIVERAERAIRRAGLTPVRVPIRGGTDGSQLSFRGLPCPNLGTGGRAFHGPFEHITAQRMDVVVDIIYNLLTEITPETGD